MFSCPHTLLRVTSDKQEQQCRQLMAGLDKVVSDLDKQEKAIYARVRPPLEQNRSLQDSTDRLQDMKVRTSAWFFGLILKLLLSAQFSPPSKECVFALCNSPVQMFLSRTLLLLSEGLNQKSLLKCRKHRASWSQTQIVPAHLNFTAKWMRPTRSTPRWSNFFSALRRSM